MKRSQRPQDIRSALIFNLSAKTEREMIDAAGRDLQSSKLMTSVEAGVVCVFAKATTSQGQSGRTSSANTCREGGLDSFRRDLD